jgi:magnesium transporter
VLAALPFALAVAALNEPELTNKADLLRRLEPATATALLNAVASDQLADIVRAVPAADRGRLLAALDAPTRESLDLLLRYDPETAGGIMTTEFLAVPDDRIVADVLATVRSHAGHAETVYVVYLVDSASGRLTQAVSLRDLVVADPASAARNASRRREPIVVHPDARRDDVTRLLSKYDLIALPVVDDAHRPIGIVTFDDVIDAIVRAQTEDVQKMGGMEAIDEPYLSIGFGLMLRKRAGWLCALFLSEMLTATAMQHFEGLLAKAIVLSLFIPLIMSSGGNSGSQATSLVIRALALREIRLRDWWRIALRELPTGIALGAILGVIGFTRVVLWQQLHLFDYGPHWALIALTIGLALVGIVTFGSLTGSMLPLLLKRLGFDPASASAPFVATLVDVTGLLIYFSIAYIVLRGTLL